MVAAAMVAVEVESVVGLLSLSLLVGGCVCVCSSIGDFHYLHICSVP